MATLVLQAAGSAIGASLGGPMLRPSVRPPAAGRQHDRPAACSVAPATPCRRAAPQVARRHQRRRRRADPARLWPCASRRPGHLGNQVRGTGGNRPAGQIRRQIDRRRQPQTVTTTYSYFANLAVALCEGPIALVRRVWADGKPLDLTGVTMRVYRGDETQLPDPLIVARQGATPGLSRHRLCGVRAAAAGRLRQPPAATVVRGGAPGRPGVAQMIRGVDLIPGATEFGYHTRLGQPHLRIWHVGGGKPQPVDPCHRLRGLARRAGGVDAPMRGRLRW
jgi:hypothetical protein